MQKTCAQCSSAFEVTSDDLAFYEKFSATASELQNVPPPTHCPDCRQQRRLARRNERSYYRRPCDLCRREMISMYTPGTPFPVYCYNCWWSDRWDPLEYGRAFDFSKPFFEQFRELQNAVPRITLFGKNNENCEYINHSVNSRNCYLCVDVAQTQDTYHSKWVIDSRNCCDCYQLEKSELCYESQYSVHLTGSIYAFLCDQSSSLAFCYDCEDCHDCFLCAHVRHKRWCIDNEQLSEKDYKNKMREWDFSSHRIFRDAIRRYHQMWKSSFHRDQQILFSEDCSGDYLYHCKNVCHSFGVIESQDCSYCYDAAHLKDCMDAYEPAFDCELQYDSHGCNGGKRLLACHICYDNDSLAYCDFCHNSSHLFGCIGLRRKSYCILNTQVTKEKYDQLVPVIIGQMLKRGEYGEFFPVKISPFAYNETVAQEYYPLAHQDVAQRSWHWKKKKDEVPKVERVIPAVQLPDRLEDIPDDVLNWAINCERTSRPFLLQRSELALYRKLRLAIPHLHPDERYRERMTLTNSRRLWNRSCAKCNKPIQTTYSPERREIVYCERCYLEAVY